MRIYLKECSYVLSSPSKPLLRDVSVLIDGGLISEIGGKRGKDDLVINCKGSLLMPALANMHTHGAMTLFRGYSEDLPLDRWLKNVWSVEARLRPEHVYAGTLLAAVEMAYSGVGLVMDMYFHMAEAARAYSAVGLRSYLALGLFDFMDRGRTEEQCRLAEEHVRSLRGLGIETAKPALGPHAIYTCSEELLRCVGQIAEEYSVPIHMHLAETRDSQKTSIKLYGVREVEALSMFGLLGRRSSFAHGVHLSDREIKLLGESGATVVHNPVSNMKLSVGGVAPVPRLISSGVNVALGTDGPGSGNRLDLFEAAKLSALIQRLHLNDPAALRVEEVLAMATENGYRALGIRGGKIEVGMVGDVVAIDLRHPTMMPSSEDRVKPNLVYSASPNAVRHLIVDGKPVLLEREIQNVDLEAVYGEFRRAVDSLFGG